MNVLMLGCTGYIGSAVAERLAGEGHTVTGLAHDDASEETLQRCGYAVLRAQLTDAEALAVAAKSADGVVWTVNVDPSAFAILPGAVGGLLDALAGSDKAFVYASAAAFYSDTGDQPADETWPLMDLPMMSLFTDLERSVAESVGRGVRGIVLRQGICYGRGGNARLLGIIDFARQSGAAPYIGSGDVKTATVHLDDLADLYVRVLVDHVPGTTLNAATEAPVSGRELAEAIAVAAGVGDTVSLDPAQAMESLGPTAFLLAGNTYVSAAKARGLGWEPRSPSIVEELTAGSYRAQ